MISRFVPSGGSRSGGLGVAHPQHQKGRKATPCKGPAEAKPEQRAPLGARDLEGVWGLQALTFCRGVAPTLYLAPNQNCPKTMQTKTNQNERNKMHKPKNRNEAHDFIKRLPLLLILTASTTPLWLTACASINRKENSIHSILEKENALIEKLQAQRKQPEVAQAVSENESLKKAEAHLTLSLEELKEANETIKTKILKANKEEVENGKN